MDTNLLLAVAFGITGTCFVYITFVRGQAARSTRRAAAVAAAALGAITAVYLFEHPAILERAASDVALGVLAGVAGIMVAVAGRGRRDPES